MGDTPYTPPTLEVIGTLEGLTLLSKEFNASDGITLNGQPIGQTS